MILLLVIHLLLLVSLQFTAWPEMVSFPYLFNNGFKLYGDMVHAYPPLLTFVLAGIYKIFGYNLIVLKIFTWIGILASDVLIFLTVKQFTGKNIFALSSLIFYLTVQPFLDGNMLWFDIALTLPILLAIYFRKNLLLAGIFLTIALLIKQTALVFIVAFFLYVKNFRFLIPIILSLGVFLLWLAATGQLTHFYNWNFYYPANFWTKYPGYEILTLTKREWVMIALVLAPAVALFFKKRKSVILFLFLAAAILAVYPRFSFYHFQPALAIAAIFFGVAVKSLKLNILHLTSYILLLALLISLPVLKTSWRKETRFWNYNGINLAHVVQEKVDKSETVYLLGPNSLLYVLSDRLPPKPWIDNFGWYFEIPGVQESVIESWKKNPPGLVIWQDPQPGNWYDLGTYRPQKIVDWIRNEKIENSIFK